MKNIEFVIIKNKKVNTDIEQWKGSSKKYETMKGI